MYIKNLRTRLTVEESSWERAERERLEGEQKMAKKDDIERFKLKQLEVKSIVEDILKLPPAVWSMVRRITIQPFQPRGT